MKRIFLFFALLSTITLHAQTDSLTVHVDGKPLADLLTDEQKQHVNYLFITGTLADEDYAFLRENNLPKLHELNLRKADIDTIPRKAFYRWEYVFEYGVNYEYSIVLPEQLEVIGDSAFNDVWGVLDYDILLTGKFPKMGFDIFPYAKNKHFRIAEDNPYCKMEDAIYSTDGKILYFNHRLTTIPETVEVIEEKAFQNQILLELIFSKSIKEIKDYAFYNCDVPHLAGPGYCWGEFVFQTEYPPVLGQEVFGGDRNLFFTDAILTVPEGCYENYINADEQWKIFKKDRSETSIKSSKTEKLQIRKTSMGWQISSDIPICEVCEYNLQGTLIKNENTFANTNGYIIHNQGITGSRVIKIILVNGKEFTVKL